MKYVITLATAVLAMICLPLNMALAGVAKPAVVKSPAVHAVAPVVASANIAIQASQVTISVGSTVAPATASAPTIAKPEGDSLYTGILIDVSDFKNVKRSPSPAIYGPGTDLVYPNRSHVPTPDEVQDESIVRYYCSMEAAQAGVCGSHPLVLKAQSIVGPAEDSVLLNAADDDRFKLLDAKLHYLDTWKVGFLMPPGQ